MSQPNKLYKTTIVIWSEYPTDNVSICELAQDAIGGESFCESQECEEITDQQEFPETEFFDLP